MPPRRSARAVSSTVKRARESSTSPVPSDASSVVGDVEDAPVKTTTRGVSKARAAPGPAPARRSRRLTQESASEHEEEDESEKEPSPVKRKRAPRRASKAPTVESKQEEEEEEDEQPSLTVTEAHIEPERARRDATPLQAPTFDDSEPTPMPKRNRPAPRETLDVFSGPPLPADELDAATPMPNRTRAPANVDNGDEEGSDESEEDMTQHLPKEHRARSPSAFLHPPSPSKRAGPSRSADAQSPSQRTPAANATPNGAQASTPNAGIPQAVPLPLPPPMPAQPSRPKPRLTIHKLVLVNFKSYASRQEIGPFHKSFSAIVGPNGSGKSNTIDALLFVFGYRASKMRQGKLSELIHNSAGRENLDSCSVEVWFREIVDEPGVDNFRLVPNSDLVVTRTAYRNNSSKYTINDRTSSFTEVTTLLKGKGIDLDHNRFLILQGEVESIALMKAKAQNEHEDGLLEYLEDIIGTTKYKQPIEDASKEIEELNDQRGEKMNRLHVVEHELNALEKKKREAEDYLRLANELTRKRSMLWQFYMHSSRSNIEITQAKIESLDQQLVDEQEANAGHLAKIADLQKEYDEKLAAFEEVKKLTDSLVKDSKKYEKEQVGLAEKKKHLTTKQKKFKKSLTEDGHARSEAKSSIDNYSGELEVNRKKVADLERKLEIEEAELEEIRDSLKDKTAEFTTQIEVKQRELEPWTTKISEKQSAIDVATSERDALAAKATTRETALEDARNALAALKDGDGSKQQEFNDLKKELAKVQKELAAKEAEVETLSGQGEQLRNKVSTNRAKADEAKASLAADKSENAVLGSLNKLKAQGRIKGFHGRLGDLGVIDDKYDVAVTTACGALNNLVVDTVEQGQACIEHLRKGNVGRASFMVLEKLPPRDLGRIETPENVPRLFDLIKPKEARFAPAFYKGLFNTLVAEDLTQAQRIGYGKKRWRVVTLAGQLIDPSGTMSGGGSRVQRGGMSSKFVPDRMEPEVVARYERDLQAAEQEWQSWQIQRRTAETELAQLRKRLPDIEIAMEKIQLDVSTATKRIADAEKHLAELKSQNKPDANDEKRIKVLEADIAKLSKEVDSLKEKSSGISDQIKELQNKIMDVGGVRLRAIQSKFTNTKGLLDLANDAITKAEVGQAKATHDVDKLAKAIDSNTKKLAEVEEELTVVQGDLDACESDLRLIKDKVQEAQDASTDGQEALAESKQELDAKSGKISEFRKLEMDIKQKIEDGQRLLKENEAQLKHWRKKHDKELKLEYVDDDEDEEVTAPEAPQALANGEDGEEAADAENAADGEATEAPPAATPKRRQNESIELVEYSAEELDGLSKDELTADVQQLEEELGKGSLNTAIIAEYRKRETEYLARGKDVETVTELRDGAKKRYDDLRKVRLDEFMAGFSAISLKLKEMYQMITMGGNAEIELIDSMDPFSEGVVLSIMPPKKSWRAIANLSGGEKTLASLALVFALHVFKPTPLYFMDEIDAALDFKNVSIVANYIQSKTQAAQFIVISLRNDMFELAHRLVGIYKTSNCTKSVAIDNKDLRAQAVPRPIGPPGLRTPAPPTPAANGGMRRASVLQEDRRQPTATPAA